MTEIIQKIDTWPQAFAYCVTAVICGMLCLYAMCAIVTLFTDRGKK